MTPVLTGGLCEPWTEMKTVCRAPVGCIVNYHNRDKGE